MTELEEMQDLERMYGMNLPPAEPAQEKSDD